MQVTVACSAELFSACRTFDVEAWLRLVGWTDDNRKDQARMPVTFEATEGHNGSYNPNPASRYVICTGCGWGAFAPEGASQAQDLFTAHVYYVADEPHVEHDS